MNKKQLVINMTASILNFVVNFAISFFLSPYIISTIGKESYGFFNLGNQFVSYATIVTAALNSMASRFITIKIHQNDEEGSNKYFSSVVLSNVILSVALFVPLFLIVVFLEKLVSIPTNIIFDVKILWTFIFANFIVGIITNVYSVATFARNKLYLNSIKSVQSNVLRIVILLLMFYLFKPSIWFLGLSTFLCTIYITLYNVYYTKKLLPDIRCKRKYFDIGCVKELLSAGIWHSFIKLASVLNNGLDLLMANIFVSASGMGTLSITRTIPLYLSQIFTLFTQTFLPELIKNYAQNDKKTLLKNIEFSRKILTIISNVPIAFLVVMGDIFFKLWLPNENAFNLQIIAISGLLLYIVMGPIYIIAEVITIANKQKFVAITYFAAGILNVILVFLLLNMAESNLFVISSIEKEVLKLLIISGVSGAIAVVRNLVFTPIYAARCIKEKWYIFYPMMFKSILAFLITMSIAFSLRKIFVINGWITFFVVVAIVGILGIILNIIVLFNIEEKKRFIELVITKLHIRKN